MVKTGVAKMRNKLKVIRQVCQHRSLKTNKLKSRFTFLIRTNCYSSMLDHFLWLLEEAKKDFPELKPEDVEIKEYGGRSFAGTFGIEWTMDRKGHPRKYSKIDCMPYIK